MHQVIPNQSFALTKHQQQFLKQKKVFVNRKKWFENDLSILCSLINAWETETLNLKFNRHSEILLEIKNVKFPYLKNLNLSGNNISSVEDLSQLFFPSLEDLFLGELANYVRDKQYLVDKVNKETQISKVIANSIMLFSINIDDNPIFDANRLTQLSTMPKLIRLSLEWKEHDCFINDCKWILKLKSEQMEVLRTYRCNKVIKSEKRVIQKEFYAKLAARFQNLDLYSKNRQ